MLRRVGERHGELRGGELVVDIGASQGELAVELGATRVSINKALKSFERRGAIALQRNEIVLRNVEMLEEYVV